MGTKLNSKFLLIRPPTTTNGNVFIWYVQFCQVNIVLMSNIRQAVDLMTGQDVAMKFFKSKIDWEREIIALKLVSKIYCNVSAFMYGALIIIRACQILNMLLNLILRISFIHFMLPL